MERIMLFSKRVNADAGKTPTHVDRAGRRPQSSEVSSEASIREEVAEHNLRIRMANNKIETDTNMVAGTQTFSASITLDSPHDFLQFVRDMAALGFQGDSKRQTGHPNDGDFNLTRGQFGVKNRRGAEQRYNGAATIEGDKNSLLISYLLDTFVVGIADNAPEKAHQQHADKIAHANTYFPLTIQLDTPIIEHFIAMQGKAPTVRQTMQK
jgi:hypothetical protein